MTERGRIWLRRILITLGIILALCIIALFFVSRYAGRYVQSHLPEWVDRASDGLYQCESSRIDLSLFQGFVSAKDLRIWPDTQQVNTLRTAHTLPRQLISVSTPSLDISGIQLLKLLRKKDFYCSNMSMETPLITLESTPDSLRKTKDAEGKEIPHISIGKLSLSHPLLQRIAQNDTLTVRTGKGDLTIGDLTITPTNDSTRVSVLFERCSSDSLFFDRPSGLYHVSSGPLRMSDRGDVCIVKGLSVSPAVTTQEFYRRTGLQKEIYTLSFPEIRVNGFVLAAALSGDSLSARMLELEGPDMEVYMNRIPPPPTASKMGGFPHQLLMKLKTPLHLDSIRINEGRISYTEVSNETKKAGNILFTAVSGTASHVTNMPAHLKKNAICEIQLHCRLMGASRLDGKFILHLDSRSGAFEVYATQSTMHGQVLNPTFRALAQAEFKSFNLNKMTMAISGNEYQASGTVKVLYDDLEIVLYDVDGKALDKKGMASFVLDKFLIYHENPVRDKEPMVAEVIVERDVHKSFFNLIWKTIFAGSLQSFLRDNIDNIVAQKILSKQEKKSERRME